VSVCLVQECGYEIPINCKFTESADDQQNFSAAISEKSK